MADPDLSVLQALADKARGFVWPTKPTGWLHWFTQVMPDLAALFIAACDPETVLWLIGRARRADELEREDDLLTFADVSEINRQRCLRWHPDFLSPGASWTGADWSNAVCGEAGEMANVVKKLRRVDEGIQGRTDPEAGQLRRMLSDEIADVYIYLDLLATFYEIDIAAAVVAKFNAISEREGMPERLGRGDT